MRRSLQRLDFLQFVSALTAQVLDLKPNHDVTFGDRARIAAELIYPRNEESD